MKIMKPILTVALVSTLMIASCFAGSKLKKNHVTIVDPKTGTVVALEAPDNAQIMVFGANGVEPGVLYATKKDGTAILIVPASALADSDDKDQSPAPAPQNQSDRERLDHAGLVKISR